MTTQLDQESTTAATAAFFASLEILGVTLRVRDLEAARRFYQHGLGLRPVPDENGRDRIALSVDGRGPALIVLLHAPGAPAPSRRASGLYHTAFLFPNRASLGRAVLRMAMAGHPVRGAADHGVSEAVYLSDPEGNGVELYADRTPETWPREGEQVEMQSMALDLGPLIAESKGAAWSGDLVAGLRVGHLHLAVEDLARARRMFADFAGLALRQDTYPGALFFGADGYHHHVAVNVWHGGGAASDPAAAGLISFTLRRGADAAAPEKAEALLANGALDRVAGFAPRVSGRDWVFERA